MPHHFLEACIEEPFSMDCFSVRDEYVFKRTALLSDFKIAIALQLLKSVVQFNPMCISLGVLKDELL